VIRIFKGIVSNIAFWILVGVMLALLIDPIGDFTSTAVVIVLMSQMIVSMHGLSLKRDDLKRNGRFALLSVACCFGISAATALLIGIPFIDSHHEIWIGFVVLAATPSAVSVVTVAFYLKGDMGMTTISTMVVYLFALLLTPLMTFAIVGEAVDPIKIFEYVLLFIAIPLLIVLPLRNVKIDRGKRKMAINVLMCLLIFLTLNHSKGEVQGVQDLLIPIVLLCLLRTFGVSLVMIGLIRRRCPIDRGITYVSMAIWKNSGLASTLCVILVAGSMAAIPCIISLIVETVWFAYMGTGFERHWGHGNRPNDVEMA